MRKRSAYRPRALIRDPLTYVLSGMAPVRVAERVMTPHMIRLHDAVDRVLKGEGTRELVLELCKFAPTGYILCKKGFGSDYEPVFNQWVAICKELLKVERYVLKGTEIKILKEALSVYVEQCNCVTVSEYETAVKEGVRWSR